MIKRSIKIGLIISIILGILCTGCKKLSKSYWNYDGVWYSENPYIYMPTGTNLIKIEVDGIRYDVATREEPDGTGMIFLDYSKYKNGEEVILWQVGCNLKNDKLYLTIIVDNISDYQGKTIELIQIPDNETK